MFGLLRFFGGGSMVGNSGVGKKSWTKMIGAK